MTTNINYFTITMVKLLFIILFIFTSFIDGATPIVDAEDDYREKTELLVKKLKRADLKDNIVDEDNGRSINIESISSEQSFLLNDKKSIDEFEKTNLLNNKDSLLKLKDKPKARQILDKQHKSKDTPFGYKDTSFVKLILGAKEIGMSTPYQFKNSYVSPKTKQFLFDFYIDKDFKERNKSLLHEYFKSINIKSFGEQQFFRVSIAVTKDTNKYDAYLDGKTIVLRLASKNKLIKNIKSYRQK